MMEASLPSCKLFLALDLPTVEANLSLVQRLKPLGLSHVKVGMSLFYLGGLPLLNTLAEEGLSVFLDLKLHDIPSTVGRTTYTLIRAGARFLNVHALGGLAMMQAAAEAAHQAASEEGLPPATLIAVTVLTSHSQPSLNSELGLAGSVEQSALRLAGVAKQAGLQGVVCSPLEAAAITQACGREFLKVTPGIRLPEAAGSDDQTRMASPAGALQAGATHLVVGRPVYAAPNPEQAFSDLLGAMAGGV
jgi:orotidine-5'-phosphate decarboxylase